MHELNQDDRNVNGWHPKIIEKYLTTKVIQTFYAFT